MTNLRFNRTMLKALVCVSAVVGGSGLTYELCRPKDDGTGTKVHRTYSFRLFPILNASWTTNFTPLPSVKWDHDWDKRSPESCAKPKSKHSKTYENNNNDDVENAQVPTPKATRHLIFIRHGQYFEDAQQDEQRILTSLGREQAELTGKRLKELGYSYSILTHSTMARASETAEIMLRHLTPTTIKTCDFLREGAPIPPEPEIGHWRPSRQFHEDGPRIEAAFRKYFYRAPVSQTKDSFEIYVCHANVIRYFVCRALQLPPEAWLRLSLHHGSITWMVIRPSGRVALAGLGDCGFMPPDKLSVR